MKPTIGRIVIYHTTEEDKEKMRLAPNCNEANHLPAIIVAVWSDTLVNLSVIYDGNYIDPWKTSINEGIGQGEWSWPKIEMSTADIPVKEK